MFIYTLLIDGFRLFPFQFAMILQIYFGKKKIIILKHGFKLNEERFCKCSRHNFT